MNIKRFALSAGVAVIVLASALAPARGEPVRKQVGLYGLPMMALADFNMIAAQQNLPLAWAVDSNKNGIPDPAPRRPVPLLSLRAGCR